MTTEQELRAALRVGEGDAPDVDRLVAAGRAARAQRRSRLLAASGVAAAVATIGIGSAVLSGNGGTSVSSDSAVRRPVTAASRAATSAAGGAAAGAQTAPPCPQASRRTVFGAEPSGSGALAGRLFDAPVASVVVCGYQTASQAARTGRTPPPARLVLTGSSARSLITSLENAARVAPQEMCSMLARADQHDIAMIAMSAQGRVLGTATTTVNEPACRTVVDVGQAVRYGWQPPAALATVLSRLVPR